MIRKFNGINLRVPGTGNPSTATSSAVDSIAQSVLIPANTFVVGDCIRIRAAFSKTATVSTAFDVKLFWNTTNSVTGATQLAIYNSLSSDTSISLYRTMTFKSGNQAFLYSTGTSIVEDTGLSGTVVSGVTLSNINITTDGYIMSSVQRRVASGGRTEDTIRGFYLTVEV
jgi:hypothetical protein